jgi:hypothetical protein
MIVLKKPQRSMSVLVLYLSILGRQSLEREQKVVFYTENNGHDQILKIKHDEIKKTGLSRTESK